MSCALTENVSKEQHIKNNVLFILVVIKKRGHDKFQLAVSALSQSKYELFNLLVFNYSISGSAIGLVYVSHVFLPFTFALKGISFHSNSFFTTRSRYFSPMRIQIRSHQQTAPRLSIHLKVFFLLSYMLIIILTPQICISWNNNDVEHSFAEKKRLIPLYVVGR